MSLLAYDELTQLVLEGVITAPYENINGSSVDITLSDDFFKETESNIPVDPTIHGASPWGIVQSTAGKLRLQPGDMILGSTVEMFNLPNDISADYKITSSLARLGLDHSNATWCSPGWKKSKLTLELRNNLKHHPIVLTSGMKIGHMMFYRHKHTTGYDGAYNNTAKTTEAR